MNKTIIAIVVVAVVLVGGYFLLKSTYQPTAPVPQPSTSEPSNQTPLPQSSAGPAPIANKNTVTYTDAGYSPTTLQVKVGETVTFKNQSSRSMWTASGKHPTHLLYPTTGGCIGSTFDACAGIQPSNDWSFRFDILGTWKYHNHLNPSDTGTIIVEK